MDSGVARQVREKYPLVFNAYQRFCKNTLNPLGRTLFAAAPDGTIIANLFAQEKFGYDGKCCTDYCALRKCLAEVRAKCYDKVIAAPYMMACHRGGGDWNKVSQMIEEELEGCNVTLYKYTG